MAEGHGPGYTPAEYAELQRQLKLLEEVAGKAKNLQDVFKNINDAEAIGRFREKLTYDLNDITDALEANAGAVNRYIDGLFHALQEGQIKARAGVDSMRTKLLDSFSGVTDGIDDKLAAVVNSTEGAVEQLNTALGALNFKEVTASDDDLKNFTKIMLEVNNALVDASKSANDNIEAIKNNGIATDEFIIKLQDATTGIVDQEEANNALLKELIKYEATAGEIGKLNERARQQKIQEIIKIAEATAAQKKENEEKANTIAQETRLAQLRSINDKARADATKGFSSLADSIFGASDKSNVFSSSLLTIISNTDKASSGFLKFGASIRDGLLGNLFSLEGSVQRLVGFIGDKLVKSTFSAGEAFAKLNRETGGVAQGMGGGAKQFAAPELAAYGVNLDKYLETQGKLINNFTKFNTLSTEQQRILTASAAKMESLGLSADQYGKLATGLYSATGKGATALAETIDKMGRDAIGMGINVGNYLNQFAGSLNKIIGYGREASTIFRELAGFAKAAGDGLTAADLSAFSEQFNNFDQAAESLTKLNAVMGGTSLNVLELQKMDPGERIMAIKRAADESGLSFDKLNIGYKRLLAEAFGGDIQKTAAFFNTSLEQAYEMMDKSSASAKELEARQKASTSAQEKLTKAIDNMRIVFSPILDAVGAFADMLISIQQKVGPGGSVVLAFGVLSGVVVGLWVAFKMAARSAFREITTELQLLNTNLAATGNMIAGLSTKAAAGAASRAGGLSGTVAPRGGMGAGGWASLVGTVAGLGISAYMMSSTAKTNEEANSAFTGIGAIPTAPDADDFIYNPKTGEAMRAESGAPIFITPDGQPIALSPKDSVVASKPGGGAIPQINNSTRSNSVSSVQQTANTSYTAIAGAVSSLKTSLQEAMYSVVGPTLGQNFVTAISNAVSSGDQNIKNIFGGGRGDVNVHVALDSDPIANTIVTKHGNKLTNKVLGDASMVS